MWLLDAIDWGPEVDVIGNFFDNDPAAQKFTPDPALKAFLAYQANFWTSFATFLWIRWNMVGEREGEI